jgi:diguanylate cyclase (GGDEF)-like protein
VAEARTDALTGVSNRRAFDDELAHRVADFQTNPRPISVAMFDVDHFKKFNDTYGHQAGDEVLRGVARVLRGNTRQTDMVARYGGEEFIVIIRNTTAAEAAAYIDRTRAAIEAAAFSYNGQTLRVTASVGVSQLLAGEDGSAWVERADTALYSAKAAGRNNVHWHDGEHTHRYPVPAEPQPIEPHEPPAKPAVVQHTPARAPVAETKIEPAAVEVSTNPMSRLLNRTGFCTNVSNRLAEYRRGGSAPAVVLTRLDRFEALSAEHGQQVVDMVLRATTKFLLAAVREMDCVASYDGTTFAMLFPDTSLGDTAAAVERLRHTIEQSSITTGGRMIRFTLSFGAAAATGSDDLERLLRRTEQALQTASWSGGNASYCHNGMAAEPATATLQRVKLSTAAQ